MTPAVLLSALVARGVELQADRDKLRFRPMELVKPGEIEAIRQHKAAILKLLQSNAVEDNAVEDMQVVEAPGTSPTRWPIIEGSEHFSIYVESEDGDWPEFIPGYHYDIRQPSRLQPLCKGQPKNTENGT